MWLYLVIFGCLSLCVPAPTVEQGRSCVFLTSSRNSKNMEEGRVNGTIQYCAHANCCVGFFRIIEGQPVAELQGCKMVVGGCLDSTCFTSTTHLDYIRCECSSNLCNGNITWNPEEKQPQLKHSSHSADMVTATVVVLGMLLCTLVVAVKCRHRFRGYDDKQHLSLPEESLTSLCSCHISKQSDMDLTSLELQQESIYIVGSGHFASVWQGSYQGTTVAVKVFPTWCRQEFTVEREVYGLPHLVHAGIAHFLGAGRKSDSGDCVLLLELATCGSLSSFLSKNSSDWTTTLKLAQSLSEGLAYLHSDFYRHGVHKPAVAHRDLSSNNVLVRDDGTCVLCDFGSSTILRSCAGPHSWQRYMVNVQSQVGTLCYMAPELLDGCVNLSSGWCLIQGDVYSLGTLLWEMLMRCSDLFIGCPVPEHRLPYEEELGASPSLEQLIVHVSERRERPSVPKHWQQGLHDILLDSWDHDSDARLTAQCARDRLVSLPPCCSI
ncbi:anti-Muellerian hormone type-2 receptor isoform X1 [Oncorhynchus mykiss]|uniref:anti-Muellerian hormone type-2 receptor isoform X1 n=2 Tax=Oncorhynchus mykiss TaxID=8022 RepID=UPI0018788A67|nr:anti-Muellerian hormone type-2 receptor isoform X1 [Oncorhynchus mykiss]